MKFNIGKRIGLNMVGDYMGLVASWLLFVSFFSEVPTAPGTYITWVLLSSFVSMLLLGAIGYFEHHIPQPLLGGIISLMFAIPISAFLSKWLLLLTSNFPPVRYTEILLASSGVALVFEAAQIIVFKIHRALGAKWTLVTRLQPAELDALRVQVQESGASWWIQILPFDQLEKKGGDLRGDETVVISRQAVRHMKDHPELLNAHLRGVPMVDIKELLKEFRGRLSLQNADAWTFLLASTYQSFPIRVYFYLKEIIEVAMAILLLVLLSPLLLVLAIGVYITKGRPILYRQLRLGYRGQPFFLYKFRTMVQTAEQNGPQWASQNDPRVSPFGKWLRKTRFDELPQLFNVIRGELSFVGPRPERPEFYNVLREHIPLFPMRLLVRPGITGWAQVRQGYTSTIEESKTKLEYDLYYVQKMSPQLDLRVVVTTVAMMLRGNSGR